MEKISGRTAVLDLLRSIQTFSAIDSFQKKTSVRPQFTLPVYSKGPGKSATRAAMEDFITKVAVEGRAGVSPYMTLGNAQWSRLGDAVVVRKMNGEFITFLDATKGGVMSMAPKGL